MASSATVHALQQRIADMQPLRLADRALPTAPELREILPGGALRKGGSYAVHGSTALGISLLSAASQAGAWCGIIGVPNLGVEAAAELGLALDRSILIPRPGTQALGITYTLSEVLSLILLGAETHPRPSETERLTARLRDHGAALIVLGDWPRTESTLRVMNSRWVGLGAGRGMLSTREITVQSQDRRGTTQHALRFNGGHLATLPTPRPGLRRVGSSTTPLTAVPS